MQPPVKKRKIEVAPVEEIKFDPAARQEYLTGFHKRKLQRAKQAQEAADKKARLERIEERRRLREGRKADLERHVLEINTLLRPLQGVESAAESQSESESRDMNSWDGILEPLRVDREAEYVDEDRYTTVTIEAMDVSKEGLHRADDDGRDNNAGDRDSQFEDKGETNEGQTLDKKRKWTRENPKNKLDMPKKKKKKFRYESKGERKVARVKQQMRNSKQASARRAA